MYFQDTQYAFVTIADLFFGNFKNICCSSLCKTLKSVSTVNRSNTSISTIITIISQLTFLQECLTEKQ